MRLHFRGLPAGLLIAGLAVFALSPVVVHGQAKKDPKKDAPVAKDAKKGSAPEDMGDRSVAFATSDGLSLKGYWFQGVGLEKQRPDAVMMFPAPGMKVTEAWIDLAKELAKKNFSVLLFDWRGCGMNGLDAGSRIFENDEAFWREPYNSILDGRKSSIKDKGLDYAYLRSATKGNQSYKDFLLNDLLGARFYLDKMSDNQKCNTNRVWIVSEKDGAQLGLAFIATEFPRNSIFAPVVTPGAGIPFKSAGKDYAGLVALSYANSNPSASKIYGNAVRGAPKEVKDHLETRLATVLLYSKKDSASASKSLITQLGVGSSEDRMKENFKYLREIDTKDKALTGIGMLDVNADTFKVKDTVVEAMVGITKAQPFGKDATDRQANKMAGPQRFAVEAFSARPR